VNVTVPTPTGDLAGWFAAPAGVGSWPGVVVVHEAFGLNDDIRRITDRFASAGYGAVAPDLFSWAATPRCLVSTFRDLVRRSGPAHDRIDATRAWLTAQNGCGAPVGIVGFCMGGGFALVAAPRGGYAAAAVNYGLVPKRAEAVLAGACPIVGSYGAKDYSLRGHAGRLKAALVANRVEHDLKEYPDVSHSFLNHHPGWMATVDKVTGFGYDEAAAQDAWGRILAFFHRHLRDGDA
jgi:carboxymethylenebutenolidase